MMVCARDAISRDLILMMCARDAISRDLIMMMASDSLGWPLMAPDGLRYVRQTLSHHKLPLQRFKGTAALTCCQALKPADCSHLECHSALLPSAAAITRVCGTDQLAANARADGRTGKLATEGSTHAPPPPPTAKRRVPANHVIGSQGVIWGLNETRLVRGKHSDEVYNAWRHSFALQLSGVQHAAAPAPLPRRSSLSHLPASPRISPHLPNPPLPPSRPAAPLTISVPAGPVSECLIGVWRRLGIKVEPKERAAAIACPPQLGMCFAS
jgi:hypothetical protein